MDIYIAHLDFYSKLLQIFLKLHSLQSGIPNCLVTKGLFGWPDSKAID